jgi:hypothetical protein
LQPPAAAGSRPAANPSDQGLYATRGRARHVPGKKRVRGVSEARGIRPRLRWGDPMSTDPATPVTLDPERSGLGGPVPIIHSAGACGFS